MSAAAAAPGVDSLPECLAAALAATGCSILFGMPGGALRPSLDALGCPVLSTYQAIGTVDTEGPLHAGLFTNGALEAPVLAEADLILAVGLDAVEPIPAPWCGSQPIIRVSKVSEETPYLPPTVDLVGELVATLAQLCAASVSATGAAGFAWPEGAAPRAREQARAAIRRCEPTTVGFGPVALVDAVAASVPAELTATVDAGAHFLAVMPLWRVSRPYGLLISNGLATMGFALPAAIGAALARPGAPVVAFTGDGGLSMALAELETLARLQLPVTVVVFNDSALSLIEIKQRATHGGPEVVRFHPVDFAAVARGLGLDADVVSSAEQLAWLLSGGWHKPRLIDVRIDASSYPALIGATRG